MSGERPIVPPIWRGTLYEFDTSRRLADAIQDHRRGYSYGRYDNPTVVEVEGEVAELEGAERGLAFASGMAAISTAVLALLPARGRVVRQRELYGTTSELFREYVPRIAREVVEVEASAPDRFEEELRSRGGDLVYLESPVNPTLEIADIARIASAARAAGAITLVDNTFATPLGQQPLALGADVSLHSATKFLGGHHDIVAGALATSEALGERLWHARRVLGGILSPDDAFLLHRGMRTLRLRFEAQSRSAAELAARLAADPRVRRVAYPGLASHPSHALAAARMKSFGAMLAFELADDRSAERFLDALRVVRRAASLGGVESLAILPAFTSHAGLPEDERRRMGITESLVRMSVGIEPLEALIEDLDRGFRAVS
ncbi:MAG: aminotransferase class I/II-fold pyridoxal phosphate-dependent enzyme [bacterium]